MKHPVTVAAVSIASKPGCTRANLDLIRAAALNAAAQGAQLVVFPELSVTGFLPNHPVGDHARWLREALGTAWQTAEPLDGSVVRELASLSGEVGVFVAAGLLENAGNVLFNTFVLAGEGRVFGHWRKMHVPIFEMPFYNGGGVPSVVETALGRIGINVCFDAFLPESTRLLGVQGCEIALFPFAADPPPGTPQGWADWARPVVTARCAENAVFGVACNYVGTVECAGARQVFPGGAMVVGPDGSVVAATEADTLLATLDPTSLTDARSAVAYTFRFRRPELYGLLTRPLPGGHRD